jgi:hypothetical protein
MPPIHGAIEDAGCIVLIELRASPDEPTFAEPDTVAVLAMIDTGADVTCIAPDVALRLNVEGHQTDLIRWPGTEKSSATFIYNLDVALVDRRPPAREKAQLPGPFRVYEIALPGRPYGALIGRDLLSMMSFNYDGPHQGFTLEYDPA